MVTTRAFALRDAGECYACQMLFEGGRFRCRPPFLFLHTKRPAPGAEAQPRCRSFYTVAPAGVEPTMGESKSPALPLGDGASVENSIAYFSKFHKPAGRFHPNFLSRAGKSRPCRGLTDMIYLHCKSFPVQRVTQKGAELMVHHLVIGIIFLIWALRTSSASGCPAYWRGGWKRPAKRPAASGSGFWAYWNSSWAAAGAVLLFLRQSDRHQHHPRGDDTRRRLHPRAVLPLAEAGKREHTGMNHGRKQYGALVLRSREL